METFKLEGKDFIPSILFDPHHGELTIAGNSFHEDTTDFYAPIMNWLQRYVNETYQPTVLNFKMVYFNTTVSKVFLQIIRLLEEYKGGVKVNWYYASDDDDMLEDGENLKADTELEFHLIELAD